MGNHFELMKSIIKEVEESKREKGQENKVIVSVLDLTAPATAYSDPCLKSNPRDLKCNPLQRNLSSLDFLMDKAIYIFS